ncbi:MAG: hypothetical protein IPM46_04050 [Flavobacteriales bacterium]|nr:hypothetical protein [Flavobacteriales bacterium]
MSHAPVPYRIRVGVTGHRKDLPTEEELLASIRHALGAAEWSIEKKARPDTVMGLHDPRTLRALAKTRHTPLRFSVHTCLAEGSDRLVAQAVMEQEGSWLRAVLPFPSVDYERTFSSPEAALEFRELLSRDPAPLVVAPAPADADARRSAYFEAGRRVVDECDVLIAIWSGAPAGGKGGTAEVIDYARSIERPMLIIRTDRQLAIEVERFRGLYCPGLREQDWLNAIQDTREYPDKARDRYIGKPSSKYLDGFSPALNAMDAHLWPLYARASMRARSYKNRIQGFGLVVYLCSMLAVLCVLLGVFITPLHLAAFIAELVLLVAILLIIRSAHRRRMHQRWLEFRYLAERCRSAACLFLFGQRVRSDRSSAHPGDRDEAAWTECVFAEMMRTMERQVGERSKPHEDSLMTAVNEVIGLRLIDGQIKYHRRNAAKHRDRNRRMERWGGALYVIAVLVASTHIILGAAMHTEASHWSAAVLTILAVMLPITAAVLDGLRKQREHGRIARMSMSMAGELEELKRDLDALQDTSGLGNLLVRIDRSLLRENREWLGLLVDRDLELMP